MDDIDMTRKAELTRDDFAFTLRFCLEMSAVFSVEAHRQNSAIALLREYFQEDISPRKAIPSKHSTSDGSITACATSCPVVVLNLEIKNEIGHGGAEPNFEGLGYFLNFFREEKWCFDKCVVPALLVTLVGANLSVNFVAHAEQIVMDPATPLIPLLYLPHDRAMMESAARCLWALKKCVKSLKQFYSDIQSTPPDSIEKFKFPYLTSIAMDSVAEPVDIHYTEQVGKKLIFRAVLKLPTGDAKIVVKFTKQYCESAHRACYECNQGAPHLYHICHLPGHWIAVVMEDIQETRPFSKESDLPALRRLVEHLHDSDIVHGDLRMGNILVSRDRVCLIDFDWSGEVDVQTYPSFMNHVDISWPEGASDGLTLKKAHDLHFLELFA